MNEFKVYHKVRTSCEIILNLKTYYNIIMGLTLTRSNGKSQQVSAFGHYYSLLVSINTFQKPIQYTVTKIKPKP